MHIYFIIIMSTIPQCVCILNFLDLLICTPISNHLYLYQSYIKGYSKSINLHHFLMLGKLYRSSITHASLLFKLLTWIFEVSENFLKLSSVRSSPLVIIIVSLHYRLEAVIQILLWHNDFEKKTLGL